MAILAFVLLFCISVSGQKDTAYTQKVYGSGIIFCADSLDAVFMQIIQGDSVVFKGFIKTIVPLRVSFAGEEYGEIYARELKKYNGQKAYFKGTALHVRFPRAQIDDLFVMKGNIRIY